MGILQSGKYKKKNNAPPPSPALEIVLTNLVKKALRKKVKNVTLLCGQKLNQKFNPKRSPEKTSSHKIQNGSCSC